MELDEIMVRRFSAIVKEAQRNGEGTVFIGHFIHDRVLRVLPYPKAKAFIEGKIAALVAAGVLKKENEYTWRFVGPLAARKGGEHD